MIKKSYVPFYQSLIFFLLAVVASVSKNTCISIFFNKFSSNSLASNFSILLSNLLEKISIQEFYDTETTTARRKQKNKTLVNRKQLFLKNKKKILLMKCCTQQQSGTQKHKICVGTYMYDIMQNAKTFLHFFARYLNFYPFLMIFFTRSLLEF